MSQAFKNLSRALSEENLGEVKKWLQQLKVESASGNINDWFPHDMIYSCGSIEIIKFLHDEGVSFNVPLEDMNCQTLIYGQIRSIHTHIVAFLTHHKADINVIDGNGDTPLSFAVRIKDRFELVPLLLEYGANPRLGNNIFLILGENQSAFLECVKNSFENLLIKKNIKLLKKQISRFRSFNAPEDFLEELDYFEFLANFSEKNDNEDEGITPEENNEKKKTKYRKFSEATTNDTAPSLTKSYSHLSDEDHHKSKLGDNITGKEENTNYNGNSRSDSSFKEGDKKGIYFP